MYEYNGPIYYFNKLIQMKYIDQTNANSFKEAARNIIYKYNKKNGYVKNHKINIDIHFLREV